MNSAILAVVCTNKVGIDEKIVECIELCKANNIEINEVFIQNSDSLNKQTAFQSGKILELQNLVEKTGVDLVVFFNHLSPVQVSAIQEICNCTVIDRTGLILEIFANRAKSKEAITQVEIARLQYEMPRFLQLTLDQDHQRGGSGVKNRGTGETKLELRKRDIERQISKLKKELENIKVSKEVQSSMRLKSNALLVVLVGYTNAGKSSLMNCLLSMYNKEEKQVYVEDLLFATLDTSIRKITLENHKSFLLCDTVGFVSDLPHNLVEAFESTLSIVRQADLILHVIDASNPHMDMQIDVVNKTLKALNAEDKKVINVFNKTDLVKSMKMDALNISTVTKYGIENLTQIISDTLYPLLIQMKILLPYEKSALIKTIKETAMILSFEEKEEGYFIELKCNDTLEKMLMEFRL